MIFTNTQDLINAYINGLNATVYKEKEAQEVLASLPLPLFSMASGSVKGSGKGKLSLPYKLVQKYDKRFCEDESQLTGDCTSHGIRNASTLSLVSDIDIRLEAEEYKGRLATETIYGARGHSGEGMSVAIAAKYVSTSGLALRQKYGQFDLSKYNPRVGINWGRTGVPKSITDLTKSNVIQTVSLVQDIEEVLDLLFNGYGIAVGSNFGFSNARDKNGISIPKGSWNHCMSVIGADDTGERSKTPLFLIANSWGEWNGGPLVLGQPKGSFWITSGVMQRMLNQRQTWAMSGVLGFPSKKINWSILDEIF